MNRFIARRLKQNAYLRTSRTRGILVGARPLFEQLEPRVLLDADTAFGPQHDISLSPANPTCVLARDLDGDGDADILSAS